jgi:sugar fermentation stimulation protein A
VKLPPLVDATFLQRLNRFAALVTLDGRETMVHVPNSGRMRELFQPGNWCGLAPAEKPGRKTAYDLALVAVEKSTPGSDAGRSQEPGSSALSQHPKPPRKGKGPGLALVSADARLPPALVVEAFHQGRLPPFAGFTAARREVTYQDSRLDIVLDGPHGRCFVEVKSVTLVESGVGLFPDSPTERGRRHVRTLARAVAEGHRAAAVFVIQREDAVALAPHDLADPAFGVALREAVAQGVEAYAYVCRVTRRQVRILKPVPVCL